MDLPAQQLSIEVHRQSVRTAGDGEGHVFVVVLLGVRVEHGCIVDDDEAKKLVLPYQIWPSHEPQRHRFRWAYRPATDEEKRMGIASHGAAETLRKAVGACLENFIERNQIQEGKP